MRIQVAKAMEGELQHLQLQGDRPDATSLDSLFCLRPGN